MSGAQLRGSIGSAESPGPAAHSPHLDAMTNELHSAGVPIDRIDHRDVARGAEVMAAEDLAPHEALTRSAVRDSLAERLVTPADVERVYSRAAGAPISPQQRSTLLRRSNTFVSLAKMAAAQPVQPRQNSLISIPSEAYRRLGIPVAPFRADVDELEKRYAGHFGSPEDMMTRIADTLAAPEWMIKQKSRFGPVNQVAVVAPLDDGQALVVRTQRHGDGYAVRAAYPLDPDRLAQMISGAGRAGADVVHVRPSIDGGHAPATGDRARADDATAPISPRDADRQAPTGTGGPAPPDARPPDPGGRRRPATRRRRGAAALPCRSVRWSTSWPRCCGRGTDSTPSSRRCTYIPLDQVAARWD